MDSITVRRDTKDMNSKQPDRFPRMNCIVVFNKTKDRILFCKRQKDPFAGRLNLVGGKVEKRESSEDSAYRELYEEKVIRKPKNILTKYPMNPLKNPSMRQQILMTLL